MRASNLTKIVLYCCEQFCVDLQFLKFSHADYLKLWECLKVYKSYFSLVDKVFINQNWSENLPHSYRAKALFFSPLQYWINGDLMWSNIDICEDADNNSSCTVFCCILPSVKLWQEKLISTERGTKWKQFSIAPFHVSCCPVFLNKVHVI